MIQPSSNSDVTKTARPDAPPETPMAATAVQTPRWRKWLRRLVIASIAVTALCAIGIVVMFYKLDQWDQEHRQFLHNGQTIKKFLKSYAADFSNAVKTKDTSELATYYSANYDSSQRTSIELSQPSDIGDVVHYQFRSAADKLSGVADVLSELKVYSAGINDVESARLDINLIEEIELETSATLTVNFKLDGVDSGGMRFEDRIQYRFWIECQTAGEVAEREACTASLDWKIVRDEMVVGTRDAGQGDAYQRLDLAAAGIDFNHRRNPQLDASNESLGLRFAVMEHAAGGVTAFDYDGDDRVDLFFPDGVESKLYRNTGNREDGLPEFEDVTAAVGLSGLDQAQCGLFVDFDNDGDKDLFVTRYLNACKLYINDGNGVFTDHASDFEIDFVAPSVSACTLDYDGDGFLDLYIAVNGNAYECCPNVPFYATNGKPSRLFRNVGGERFEDVTESSGTGTTGWSLAVAAGDYNSDGLPDLLVANDFGRKVLYRNNGDGTFTDTAKAAGILDLSGGMGVSFGDFNDDGNPDVYTSNINSNQRWFGEDITIAQYMNNVIRTGYLWSELAVYRELYNLLGDEWSELGKMVGEGNSLFSNNADGTFTECNDSQTRLSGWSWSVGFFDFDNDADLDLFVANGWISGREKDDL